MSDATSAAATAQRQSPGALARETIRLLAQRRIPPTPENYARLYAELGGGEAAVRAPDVQAWLGSLAAELARVQRPGEAGAGIAVAGLRAALERAAAERDPGRALAMLVPVFAASSEREVLPWAELVRELIGQWEAVHADWTAARKRESLERVLAGAGGDPVRLATRLRGLVRAWAGARAGTDGIADAAGPITAAAAAAPDAAARAPVRVTTPVVGNADATGLGARVAQGLLRIVRLVVANLEDLVPDRGWVRGQVGRLRAMLDGPLDAEVIGAAEQALGEVVAQQRSMKQDLDAATSALKDMLAAFVSRLGEMSASAGGFETRLGGYQKRVREARDIGELSGVIAAMLDDTRGVQAEAGSVRDALRAAHAKALEYEARVGELEQRLARASDLAHEDALTGILNRRGLDAAYIGASARAERTGGRLCIALLDIDNFKKLNDTYGHSTGDEALRHLAALIRETLRVNDAAARYGGEEFVILFPDASPGEAAEGMQRLQRQLTRRFFMHNNEKLLITFSAGVAERAPGESREALFARADASLYEAKRTGKNRVVIAAPGVTAAAAAAS